MIQIRSLLSFLLLLPVSSMAEELPNRDVTALPFEELLQTEYIPASRIANQISNSASAVSVVTAQDIRDYGYRTLGDILGSMRGLHTFQDYTYTFLAGRGYSSPNEYAGRIAILIDGYRADDSMFGQAYLGNDGILDVSMIDRVEYIPGGSSAAYSNGALLGVINIITKKGSDIDGVQLAAAAGSHESTYRRATYGKRYQNGADILISYSAYDSEGQTYTYDDSITQEHQHGESSKKLFLKGSYDALTFTAAFSKRDSQYPTYPYADETSDLRVNNHDLSRFLRLAYDSDLSRYLKLSASVWHGYYRFAFEDPVSMAFMDTSMKFRDDVKWYGSDVKLVGTWFEDHVLSVGGEYRHDYTLDNSHVFTDVVANEAWWSYYGSYEPRKTYSIYAYDEWLVSPLWQLNYGFRYEKSENGYHALSPQAALIWKPRLSTEVKLSSGITHRQATPSEDDTLTPEQVFTTELVFEEKLDPQSRIVASLYQYRLRDQISYKENNGIDARGAEIEFEKHWENGTRLRTSYAYQNVYENDSGLRLINAPHHIGKFNLSTPLSDEKLRLGMEVHYLGRRPLYTDERQEYAPSYTLANMTLLSHDWIANSDLSLTVKNIFDKKYGDVIQEQANGDLLFPQSGRTFWLQWEYNFR